MADFDKRLESAVARIYGPDKEVMGAGFRVSEKHLFTCAHVVAAALRVPSDSVSAPAGEVELDFPLVTPNRPLTAKVVYWSPVQPAGSDAYDGKSDIAVLELQANAPEGSRPAQIVRAENFWDHECRAFGFPDGSDAGLWAIGVLRGSQAYGWVQIDGVGSRDFFIAQGFSGTLVWDVRAGGVAGMVVAVEGRSEYKIAYMIPADILVGIYPELALEVAEASCEPPSLDIEPPGASADPRSPFYVARASDAQAEKIIEREGTTTTIKGSGQMGKTTLRVYMIQKAEEKGRRVVSIDLQQFDQATLDSADIFFRQFCSWVSYELDLADRTEEYWGPFLGNVQKATRYIGNYVLKAMSSPLMLAIEEVDRIFSTAFRKEFFGMLRSWHEARGPTLSWRNLNLVLVTSTEPYRFIDDVDRSPFVGDVIELRGFTQEEAAELNRRHGSPLAPADVTRLVNLVAGHPYLLRSALYQVATGQIDADLLFEKGSSDDGPFAEHLGYHYLHIIEDESLVKGLRQVIGGNVCQDERVRIRLLGAGLAYAEGSRMKPRSPLYAEYFKRRLP